MTSTDKAASRRAAANIRTSVLDALQAADELGGPDYPEYVDLMRDLANECAGRADIAADAWREYKDLEAQKVVAYFSEACGAEAFEQSTGGGFTCFEIPALLRDGNTGCVWHTMFAPAGCLTRGAEALQVIHHVWVGSKAPWDEMGDSGKQHPEGFRS